MARRKKPDVSYWPSKGGYGFRDQFNKVVIVKGPEDYPDGPTYQEATRKYGKMLMQVEGKGTDDYRVSACLNAYRNHVRAERMSQADIFDIMAKSFCDLHGSKRVCEITLDDLLNWLRDNRREEGGRCRPGARRGWNETTQNHAGLLVMAAFSHAKTRRLIQTNPLEGCAKHLPAPVMRGEEARMSAGLCDLLIAEARKNKMRSHEFADLLWALRETGARPREIWRAEAFNYTDGQIVYHSNTTRGYVWKNAKKAKQQKKNLKRIINLTPELREHVEALVRQFPTGPLFRTPRGEMWSLTSICNKWQWLITRPAVVQYARDHGVPTDFNRRDKERAVLKPCFFRHTWISNYLDDTGDYYGCAQMCGTPVKMLEQRYGHPDEKKMQTRYLDYMTGRTTGR